MPPKRTSRKAPKLSQREILDKLTNSLINRIWFTYASKLLNEVAQICELTPEQKDVLEYIHLKPNNFDVNVI